MEKMIKKVAYERLIEIVNEANVDAEEKEMLIERLEKDIELASKKKATMTKNQKENEGLIEVVYEAIKTADHELTVGEIYNIVKDKDERFTSENKVSALVTKLKRAERIVRNVDKKVARFSVPESE